MNHSRTLMLEKKRFVYIERGGGEEKKVKIDDYKTLVSPFPFPDKTEEDL